VAGPIYARAVIDEREAAWDAVHEALPARWAVGLPSQHPSTREWTITARGPHPGRGKHPPTVTGAGESEIEALRDLDRRLRGSGLPAGSMNDLRARLRLAYVQGAEGWARGELGRGLTSDELIRVIDRGAPTSDHPRRSPGPGADGVVG
jgi:hypothetical protein